MISIVKRFALLPAVFAALIALQGCGGSGAGAAGASGSSGTGSSALKASTAASLTLTADSTSIDSDGRKAVTLIAITKNADNVVLKGAGVSFSTTDAGTTITPSDTKTDVAGLVTALIKTTDKTTRVIKITVQSDTLISTIDIAVIGTTLSINGPTGLGFGGESEYSVVLKDSGGSPISGQVIKVTTANKLTAEPAATDSQGQAKFKISGTKAGADTLSVAALGSTALFEIGRAHV